MASSDPVLYLIAGPNGAGKTTLVNRVVAPATNLPFVHADDIAAQRWPEAQAEHAYQAADVAAEQRRELIAAGQLLHRRKSVQSPEQDRLDP